MIIKEKLGNITDINVADRAIDYLLLEWYETTKRILHKTTTSGIDITLKFMAQNPNLTEGDVLFENEKTLIIVSIKPSDAMVIRPGSMYEMAFICYEIGNKHLPLFYDNDELLVPYESPLFKMLLASGYKIAKEERKLLNPLKTSVTPHGHGTQSKSLFSKIMQLTSSND